MKIYEDKLYFQYNKLENIFEKGENYEGRKPLNQYHITFSFRKKIRIKANSRFGMFIIK